MNLMEFKAELEKLEIPIQYRSFSVGHAPELPYILFYENDSDNVFADNHNYYDVLNVSCELYADEKDIELETKLQKLLYDNEIEYNSTETFIDSENMYLKAYDIVITFDSLADVKEKEVDKSNLKSLIDYVETLKSDAYEVDGFSKLETVLAYAKAVLIDMETVQDEVDEIEIELLNALNGLIVLKIDKTQLKAQIDYVKTLSAVEYTTESWGVLKIALANAEAVYGNDNATQSNVNDVLNKLFESYQNLQKPTGGFEKGVNLYAPLSWQAQGLYGGLDYSTGEVNDHTFYIHSDFIKIPDKSPSVSMQTKGSDSIYIFIYDENKMFMKNEYVYGDVSKTFEILRKARYIRTYSYKQTPSSILINKTKIEFGEKTDWTIAPEDEEYMKLQLI
ncbi:FIVAR domain-containing protein [Pseudolactococcus raffinolactis]|uniref:FIVAR domain-containing protein n=6 Tax=Pseudolactococcus raffinolactis TaxID=1366 RepID=UPI0013D57810|nr:FIVAR domain-containing protein [Lactococcus raffinolactis]